MNSLSERIKLALAEKKMTQAGLAKKLGITRAAVSAWCTSSTKDLSATNALLIAQVLDVDPYWLVFGRGSMRSPDKLSPKDIEIIATVQKLDDINKELASRLLNQLEKSA